ncbi:lytic polysaccharide monooxygenase [Microbacterium sp. CR_7]|uniref:lytic polysaccharide monooxygenase n=1 Tax=Microbacterium sp. CR_7 TaxID=3055792 RepID=UPI0035C0FC27
MVTASGLLTAPAPSASAHGYVGGGASSVISRAAWSANTDRGSVAFEPQSLEAPKGFPTGGPADGQLASAGGLFDGALDEQSATRWAKNVVQAGPVQVSWTLPAAHRTAQWRYFITKQGWNPDAPLDRGDFEPLATFDGRAEIPGVPTTHTLTIPSDHIGYHVIYAVWDIADTTNAFYNTIDIDVRAGGAVITPPTTPVTPPVTPTTPPTRPTPPTPTSPPTPATPAPSDDIAAWSPTGSYTRGDLRRHEGVTYRAVQTHRAWGDPSWITALSLWEPLTHSH